jgi:pimeloyl-ACP methyl ester carboxylesterase
MLQFDKRGVGESTGDLNVAGYADLRDDAAALAKWLRQQPGIDARRIGVLGGSEGGMIAVSVAAMDPDVAFVISMAGPAQSAADRMISVNAQAMREQGVPQKTIDAISKMSREGVAALALATSDDDAARRVTAALKPYVGKLMTQAEADQMAALARDPVARARMLHDPKTELQRIKVPVLGLFGSLDLQVPADENAAAMRAGLKDNPDVTVVTMPGFNHLFQHAKTGTIAEWSTLKEVSASDPEFLKIITEWVRKRTAPR